MAARPNFRFHRKNATDTHTANRSECATYLPPPIPTAASGLSTRSGKIPHSIVIAIFSLKRMARSAEIAIWPTGPVGSISSILFPHKF